MANTAWAFVTAGVHAPELFAAVARAEHELEVSVEDSLLVVDVACEHTRMAVELDASHFMVDASTCNESYDGSTRSKTRTLEALGWRV